MNKCCENCCVFRLILMDLYMPVMNGFDATSNIINILNLHSIPKIPIVAYSAFTTENKKNYALKSEWMISYLNPVRLIISKISSFNIFIYLILLDKLISVTSDTFILLN